MENNGKQWKTRSFRSNVYAKRHSHHSLKLGAEV